MSNTATLTPVSLQVKNFRALADFEINFDAPLLELVGPNGAGKTSAMLAIEFLLCGAVEDENGSRIPTDRLKHRGEDIEVTMVWRSLAVIGQAESVAIDFKIRRSLGSKHTIEVLHDGNDIWSGIPVREWEEECVRLFNTGTSEIRALLRSDRFIRMSSREQATLAANLLRVEVNSDVLLDGFPEELRVEVSEMMPPGKEGAALLAGLNDAAVATRRIRKREKTEAEARVNVALEVVAARKLTRDALRSEIADDEEARAMLVVLDKELGARAAAQASVVSAETRISEIDSDSTSLANQVTDLRAQADANDAEFNGWEARKAALTATIEEAEAAVTEAETALEAAQTAHISVRDEEAKHDGALGVTKKLLGFARAQVENSEAGAKCPLCGADDVDWSAILEQAENQCGEMEIALGEAVARNNQATQTESALREQLASSRNALKNALDARAAIEATPTSGNAIRAQIAPLQHRRRELDNGRLEAISHLNSKRSVVNATRAPEKIEGERDKINTWVSANQDVELAEADVEEARASVTKTDAKTQRAETIAALCAPETLMEAAVGNKMDALIEILNSILDRRGWKANVAADMTCTIQEMGREVAPEDLSRGEQLYLGAAWQTAFAHYLGIGLIVLDDGALLDGYTYEDLRGAIREIGAASEVGTRCVITRVPAADEDETLRVVHVGTAAEE